MKVSLWSKDTYLTALDKILTSESNELKKNGLSLGWRDQFKKSKCFADYHEQNVSVPT